MHALRIIWNGLALSLNEFRNNKLRTFLSLLGIIFGIICIVGVFAAVTSLERNVKNDLKSLGTNTIYVQKWPWGGGSDYPWWKYINRPLANVREMYAVKEKVSNAKNVAYVLFNNSDIEYEDNVLQSVNWTGVTEEYNQIQPVQIVYGRYLNTSEFSRGANVVVIGYIIAEKLFDDPTKAVGKEILMDRRKVTVVGVVKKQGQSTIGGWDFDNSTFVTYGFVRQFVNENSKNDNRFMMVSGKENIPVTTLKEELRGVMRAQRKLGPMVEDNFALNDITASADQLNSFFGSVSVGGFVIAILSLIVGAFGVANIMFVTVKERTSQIGLKKAIGAKRGTILLEFLLESAMLCIIGGLIGVFIVFLMTLGVTAATGFDISISPGLLFFAISVCIVVGILSGIVPANQAAKMDPVVAIRSK